MKTSNEIMKIQCLMIALLISCILYSQDSTKVAFHENEINLHVGSSYAIGALYSRNIQLVSKKLSFLSLKAGIGYNAEIDFCIIGCHSEYIGNYLTIPHAFTYNVGGKNGLYFEVGISGAILTNGINYYYVPGTIIGLHAVPYKNNINGGLYFSPTIPSYIVDNRASIIYIPFGIYIGYAFSD